MSEPVAEPEPKHLYIVGVGASAGGLEALQRLFERIPLTGQMAFVVVQHLSPDFKSLMDELLTPHTRMQIHRAEDGMQVEADHIYLMPAKNEMIVAGGRLLLTERDPSKGLSLPIDSFFRSMAEDVGTHGIAVVLSGTGSDGSRGIRSVHEAGGLVIAQTESSAKFDGMPRSAVDTGIVDLVLAPEDIGDTLVKYLEHDGRLGDPEAPAEGEDVMGRIFELLKKESGGIDFADYKGSTVGRRIERRLLLTESRDLDEYVTRISQDGEELSALYKDMLIGVTRFFRDPDLFQRLKTDIIPQLVRASTEEVRVWVPAVASGEEAYSLAMLIDDAFRQAGRPPVFRIFATDVHRPSLEAASSGHYPLESLVHVPAELRDRYFERQGDGYQVSNDLRGHIVFAHHNVLRDAPFTRLDLVSCRNFLIYLKPPAQRRVLALFHFGLKTGGTLLLGPSETPGPLSEEFATLDTRWKLFRKSRDVRIPDVKISSPSMAAAMATRPIVGRQSAEDPRVVRGREALLNRYSPPTLLVDENGRLLHSFNGAGDFLSQRDGKPSLNVLELLEGNLRFVVAGALKRTQKDHTPVTYGGVEIGKDRRVRVVVSAVPGDGRGDECFAITFEEERTIAPETWTEPASVDSLVQDRLSSVENELRVTKENLQATIEEMETSNEELQATNEELIASNEELQSTNEELHSVNEELYTVNAEYQAKIAELTELTADMNHLLEATEVHTIFLDSNLRLRKFTPKVAQTFNLLPQDLGRRIDAFAHNLRDDGLVRDLERVAAGHPAVEREVEDREGRPHFLRVLPYRTAQNPVDGVVVTLVDLSPLRMRERTLQRKEDQIRAILDHSPAFIWVKDPGGRYLVASRQSQSVVGVASEALLGKTDHDFLPLGLADQLRATERRCLETGETVESEEIVPVDGRSRTVLTVEFPLRDEQGQIYALSGIASDITERKRDAEEIRQAVERRDQFLAMLSHELRTPLGAILNAADLLERGTGERPPSYARDVIRRQTRHMAKLVDDLLDVGRVTRDQLVLDAHLVDVRGIVEEVVETLRPDAERRGLQLEMTVPAEPLPVQGDSARLRQIFTNLINNAVGYTPSGRIDVALHNGGPRVAVSVHDTGMGLSAEDLTRVFELFYQTPQALDRKRGGLGVGLTLALRLARLHGGDISADSPGQGKGCTFTVTFPRADGAVDTVPDDAQRPAAGLRIVLVEDNEDIRDTLQDLLRMEGHEVVAECEGIKGADTIVERCPDVAIVDLGLPGMDGFAVAKRVRGARGSTVRLIALTGYGGREDRMETAGAGFDRHLVKPIDHDMLMRVLAEIAANRRSMA
jgi:two-component system CheB/CheR fusion protein